MNILALLKARTNRSTEHRSQEALFKIGLLAFLLLCISCQTTSLSVSSQSSIDTHYKLRQIQKNHRHSESASVRFYQKILRQGLYSHCKYFPSDSTYSQIVSKQCGSFVSLFKTYDRFIRESDAAQLGLRMTVTEHGAQFIDLPKDCDVY